MNLLKQKLPLTYLLLVRGGRLGRIEYVHCLLLLTCLYYLLITLVGKSGAPVAVWILRPLLLWGLIATSSKRLHDQGKSGRHLIAFLIPVIGPIWLAWKLFLRKGEKGSNLYGPNRNAAIDYLRNDQGYRNEAGDKWIINDVTKINPVEVQQIIRPATIDELTTALKTSLGKVSVGGGRFSMGGQTAHSDSLHIDLRSLNRITAFSESEKWIRVQAGIRWCDIQQHIDKHDLSVKIMQTYANFTVGGALNVNAHGRYIGLGPVVLSVRWIDLLLADGRLVRASRTENTPMFFAAIGGYAAIGIIVEVELDLADNQRVERNYSKMPRQAYAAYFQKTIRNNPASIFHNGDIYPPTFDRVRAVTWSTTELPVTVETRLMPLRDSYPIARYFIWAFCETPFGHWRREKFIEPLLYLGTKVHWRNYEAGYDVAELEPRSRDNSTYVLQEYFVPVAKFDAFSDLMAEIFIRHKVKVLNISIRHAFSDPGTFLAWAREEVFAFVVYYKQGTSSEARGAVAVWTRELIEAAVSCDGTYYLPYQPHATVEQFHKAYPRANELFVLKQELDPNNRFSNVLWEKYYTNRAQSTMPPTTSEFHAVFDNTTFRDAFYKFLQVVFHLFPEDKFHHLIAEVSAKHSADEPIYREVQKRLSEIKPFLSELTLALPALRKQKAEMTRQTVELLGAVKGLNGYLEIGSTGRYISDLKKHVQVMGSIFLINDIAPNNGVGDIFERGQFSKIGRFIPLNHYAPIDPAVIPDNSLDLVTIYIGFHHCPSEKLIPFIKSIHRVMRPGASLIVREHDVKTAEMGTFVSLVHTVFNLGLGVPWETDSGEFKSFRSIDEWVEFISQQGFKDTGKRLFQHMDPSDNALIRMIKL